ncbi:HEAT repeat domain-containing protein [Ralstonia pseudosolanacearum]
MNGKDDINAARDLFVTYAQDFWSVLKERGHKPANKISDKASALIKYWGDRGRALEFLHPLLLHEVEAVRYWAATGLIDRGAQEEAVRVLQDVSKNPKGFMAIAAQTLLEKRGIPVSTNGDVH